MVGIVVVSHSRRLAEAAVELALQMVRGTPPPIEIAAGLDDHVLGTDAAAGEGGHRPCRPRPTACSSSWTSAAPCSAPSWRSSSAATPATARSCSPTAPLVEGLVAAVALAAAGAPLAEVAADAGQAGQIKTKLLGVENARRRAGQRAVAAGPGRGHRARPPQRPRPPRPSRRPLRRDRPPLRRRRHRPQPQHRRPGGERPQRQRAVDPRRSDRRPHRGRARPVARPAKRSPRSPPWCGATSTNPCRSAPCHSRASERRWPDRGVAGHRHRPEDLARRRRSRRREHRHQCSTRRPRARAAARRLEAARAELTRRETTSLAPPARTRRRSSTPTCSCSTTTNSSARPLERSTHEPHRAEQAWRQRVDALAGAFDRLDRPVPAGPGRRRPRRRRRRCSATCRSRRQAGRALAGILVAADLTPAQAAQLDPGTVLGIVTALGSPVSHGAILARSLGIPAVVGAGDERARRPRRHDHPRRRSRRCRRDRPRRTDVLAEYRAKAAGQRQHADHAARGGRARRSRPTACRIEVVANIASRDDAVRGRPARRRRRRAAPHRVPVPRPPQPPDEDEQLAAYLSIAEALDGRRLTVRTLDVGGDKPVPYLPHRERGQPVPRLPRPAAQPPASRHVQAAAAGARPSRDAASGHRPLPDGDHHRRAPSRSAPCSPTRPAEVGCRRRRASAASKSAPWPRCRLRAPRPGRRGPRRPHQHRHQRPDAVHAGGRARQRRRRRARRLARPRRAAPHRRRSPTPRPPRAGSRCAASSPPTPPPRSCSSASASASSA